jgi:hypothetical protein
MNIQTADYQEGFNAAREAALKIIRDDIGCSCGCEAPECENDFIERIEAMVIEPRICGLKNFHHNPCTCTTKGAK